MRPTSDILVRTAIAALATLFVFVCANGGVSLHGWLGVLQVGVICGVVAGALAPRPWAAFAAGMIGGFLGAFAFIAWFIGGDLGMSAAFALVTALVALGCRLLLDRTRVTSLALALAGVALVVAGMWVVTWQAVNTVQPDGMTAVVRLEQRPVPGQRWGDGTLHKAVVFQMRDGMSYYQAFKWVFDNNGFTMADPSNVVMVKPPALFYLWAVLPGWPVSLVWSLLALASVACVACVGIAGQIADPVLGLGAASALAAYTMVSAASPQNVNSLELWGGLLAVFVLFAYVRSFVSPRHRAWTIAAAALAFSAFAVRELMIFLPIAALLATPLAPKVTRRFDAIAWAATLGACVALWAAQLAAASRITTSVAGGVSSTWLGNGGVQFLLHGITYNSRFLSAAWVPFVLAALGLLGALAQRPVQARVFCLLCGAGPLAAFLVVGNAATARDLVLKQPLNYWGAIVMPLLIALSPAAFALLPGLRRATVGSSAATERLPKPATAIT